MTYTDYLDSMNGPAPPAGTTDSLQALWYAGKNMWEKAHDVAQEIISTDGSWVHAYLHRVEGDKSNADYWYAKAGKPSPTVSLKEEWEEMVKELLEKRESDQATD